MADPDLSKWGTNALRELESELQGHGGYNPMWPCMWCDLKDTIRKILEERGD